MQKHNAFRKLEKHGYNVKRNGDSNIYTAHHPTSGYVVEFMADGDGKAKCFTARRANDKPDSQTDYFPSISVDTLSQAMKLAS